jgi:AraC family transcriptional regulator
MGPRLPGGRFFGTTLRRRRSGELTVSEVEFPAGARVPPHSHEKPIFNFVLSGGYTEYWNGRSMQCRRPVLLFHAPGVVHSERFSSHGARCLTLEFDPAWIERVREDGPILNDNVAFPHGEWSWVSVRLRDELRARDDLSTLVLEGFLQILLAAAARGARPLGGRRPPHRVELARELLHERFAERLQIGDIAEEVGLHPTYLARAFRQYFRSTPGEYARRLRVEFACRQLADPERPLAQVAQIAGYADQSHFTRAFRRLTGMTPGAYREALRR